MTDAVTALAEGLVAGQRRALARAITLVESTRADHGRAAEQLLEQVLPLAGRSIRVGITGTPGVGKSTFIDALGMALIDAGRRPAVLAVDPSSATVGGSILGDKTRMSRLAASPRAFIRPSPSGGISGGVAARTRDAVTLCEAAGFDTILVETVGVGQSETAVANLTDIFLLLLAPGGGDDLQGIKRGVMELADVVAVNKSDGPLVELAARTALQYEHALHLLRPKRPGQTVPVLRCSAHTGDGLVELWSTVEALHRELDRTGALGRLRVAQAQHQLDEEVRAMVYRRLADRPGYCDLRDRLRAELAAGTTTVSQAARLLADQAPAPAD